VHTSAGNSFMGGEGGANLSNGEKPEYLQKGEGGGEKFLKKFPKRRDIKESRGFSYGRYTVQNFQKIVGGLWN